MREQKKKHEKKLQLVVCYNDYKKKKEMFVL